MIILERNEYQEKIIAGDPEVYTPDKFAAHYSGEYGSGEKDDSPEKSRAELIDRLFAAIENTLALFQSVTILDLGAGRQILESELQAHPRYEEFKDRIKIFTLDIAKLSRDSNKQNYLLAKDIDHVEANGAKVPFASNSFDIVITNMAIDFMPRDKTFAELLRVIKDDGIFLGNFHHLDLTNNIDAKVEFSKKRLFSKQKDWNIRMSMSSHPDVSKRPTEAGNQKALKKIEKARTQHLIDLFLRDHFPQIIFHSGPELSLFLHSIFTNHRISVKLRKGANEGTNSWYEVHVTNKERKE